MSDPWRYRCPEGHTSGALKFHTTRDTYRCTTCGETYDGTPVDRMSHGDGGEA